MKASKFVIGGLYKYNKAAVAEGFARSMVFKLDKLLGDGWGAFRENEATSAINIPLSRLKRTPCTKLGYVVGDVFTVPNGTSLFAPGAEVTLAWDDGTESPFFNGEHRAGGSDASYGCHLSHLRKKEL